MAKSLFVCITALCATVKNEHIAKLLRKKTKIMVAHGVCAAFGGIPGLANVTTKNKILDTVYDDTATTLNPENTRPQTQYIIRIMINSHAVSIRSGR